MTQAFSGTLLGILSGVAIGLIYILFTYKKTRERIKKKMEPYFHFVEVLMIDYKEHLILEIYKNGILNLDTNVEDDITEVIKKFYPKLPLYKKMFKYPIPYLIERVDWSINYKEHFPDEQEHKKERC